MSRVETAGLKASRTFTAIRRATSLVLHAIAGAGCIMAALGAGMNRNPIISVVMLVAAAACFWRLIIEVKAGQKPPLRLVSRKWLSWLEPGLPEGGRADRARIPKF